jgi:hypothetical protein
LEVKSILIKKKKKYIYLNIIINYLHSLIMVKSKQNYSLYFSQNLLIFFWKVINIYFKKIFHSKMKKKLFFYKQYTLRKKLLYKESKHLIIVFPLY